MAVTPPALPVSGKSLCKKETMLTEVPSGMVSSTIVSRCAPFDREYYGEGFHMLHFLPEATSDLYHCVQYGKKRASNVHEQQFIGLGHDFIDDNHRIHMVVTRIIPIFSASRGPTHAKVISEGKDAMLDVLENERNIQNQLEAEYNVDEDGYTIDPFLQYGPSKVVLFGHTHPDLGCFFSSVDHRSNYSTPSTPIVTFVCDPIRKDMKAMVGIGCDSMKIIVCHPKSATAGRASQNTPGPRVFSIDDLWQRVSAVSNLLLVQTGVKGNFDCYRDWRGRIHMFFKITYTPPKKQQRK